MNTRQALERLQRAEITTSKQMLLRWLRQGKIEAVLGSKKEGYVIDERSLEAFIVKKRYLETEDPAQFQLAYKKGYRDGLQAANKQLASQALETKERMIAEAIRAYQKELILKKCYETSLEITSFDKNLPRAAKAFLEAYGSKTVQFGVLGTFALFEGVDLIDLTDLPYPTRKLKTRLGSWLATQYKNK